MLPRREYKERLREWLVRQLGRSPGARRNNLGGFVLVFDEIQKVPQWSEIIKGLWDADRARDCPLHVVILGSAPLLMQSGLSESLAGRFESIRVTHWSFDEMSAAFDFDLPRYLYFGSYPGAAPFVRDPRSMARLYPRRTRRAEYRTRPPRHDPSGQTSAAEAAF